MSATILQFPRRKPLGDDEVPAHWPEGKKGLYMYWTSDGYMTHQEAFERIEEKVRIETAAQAAGKDPLLALARDAVLRLPLRDRPAHTLG